MSPADDGPGAGVTAIRYDLARAEDVVNPAVASDPSIVDLTVRTGCDAGAWEPDLLGLPPDCPVTPLGVDGDLYYFLDTINQLRAVTCGQFGRAFTTSLFMGRSQYLYWAWPRHNKDGLIVGWRNEQAYECLSDACARRGTWSDADKVRGRGAWRDAHGGLVLHTGRKILYQGSLMEPKEIDGYVYPARPALPQPWHMEMSREHDPALLLLPLFRTWNWARPDLDPVLLLGWIAAAFLGGALKNRPAVYILGDKGTGKSVLQEKIKAVMGSWIIQAVDATAAGIWQKIGNDSLAVGIDEIEGKKDGRRNKAVIDLMRAAFSGGPILRGGDKHVGAEFQARSAFLFSSINTPPLQAQDLSRMAMLKLGPISGKEPDITDQALAIAGSMMLRRLMDGWPSFGDKHAAYREQLAAAGHDGRGQDTYGTLLACAELVIGERFEALDVPMGEDLSAWRRLLAIDDMAEFEDAAPNWLMALNHMLSVDVDAWKGGQRQTVGQVLEKFNRNQEIDFTLTRETLAQAGLGLWRARDKRPGGVFWLAVPNQHPKTRALFADSTWGGDETAGVWANALRQAPRELWDMRQMRVAGGNCRCTMISLDGLYGDKGCMGSVE